MNECSLLTLQPNLNQKWQRLNSPLIWTTIVVFAVMALIVISGRMPTLDLHLFSVEGFQDLANRMGAWGPIIYIGLLIISVVASQIPGAPLAIAAGALWGPFTAGLYTLMGGFLGAMIAYFLGKYLGQSFFKILTGKTITITPDLATNVLGWLIFVSRLVPVLSFDLISYGAGMAGLSMPVYASATFVGMIPSTLLLTYLGGTVQSGHQQVIVISVVIVLSVGLLSVLNRFMGSDLKALIRIGADEAIMETR